MKHLPANFGQHGFIPPSHTAFQKPVPQIPPAFRESASAAGNDIVELEVGTTVDEAERQLILKTLESTNNNKTRAAEILGISSKTLQNKLKEYASAGEEA